MSKVSKHFITKEYYSEKRQEIGNPTKKITTIVEFNEESNFFLIETDTREEGRHKDHKERFRVSFQFRSKEQVEDLSDLISRIKNKPDGTKISEEYMVEEGSCFDSANENEEEFDKVLVEADDSTLKVSGGCLNCAFIDYTSEKLNGEPENKENLIELENFMKEIQDEDFANYSNSIESSPKNNITIEGDNNGLIQQAGERNTQSIEVEDLEYNRINEHIIPELDKLTNNSSHSFPESLSANAETLKEEIESEDPDEGIIKESLKSIRKILENTTAKVMGSTITKVIENIDSVLN